MVAIEIDQIKIQEDVEEAEVDLREDFVNDTVLINHTVMVNINSNHNLMDNIMIHIMAVSHLLHIWGKEDHHHIHHLGLQHKMGMLNHIHLNNMKVVWNMSSK